MFPESNLNRNIEADSYFIDSHLHTYSVQYDASKFLFCRVNELGNLNQTVYQSEIVINLNQAITGLIDRLGKLAIDTDLFDYFDQYLSNEYIKHITPIYIFEKGEIVILIEYNLEGNKIPLKAKLITEEIVMETEYIIDQITRLRCKEISNQAKFPQSQLKSIRRGFDSQFDVVIGRHSDFKPIKFNGLKQFYSITRPFPNYFKVVPKLENLDYPEGLLQRHLQKMVNQNFNGVIIKKVKVEQSGEIVFIIDFDYDLLIKKVSQDLAQEGIFKIGSSWYFTHGEGVVRIPNKVFFEKLTDKIVNESEEIHSSQLNICLVSAYNQMQNIIRMEVENFVGKFLPFNSNT
ncbi:MAG: hypothetical protein OHK0017_05820 [Patescibacteria group bacterium]